MEDRMRENVVESEEDGRCKEKGLNERGLKERMKENGIERDVS